MKLSEGWMTPNESRMSGAALLAAGRLGNALLKMAQEGDLGGIAKIYHWAVENGDYFFYDLSLKLIDEVLVAGASEREPVMTDLGIDAEKDLEKLKVNAAKFGKSYYLR